MYPIADMLVQIKNAQAAGKESVWVPFSKTKFKIAQLLKENGLIKDIEKKFKKDRKIEHGYIFIQLGYNNDKSPNFGGMKIISRPSRHIYIGAKDIKPVRSGLGFSIISTSRGLMSSKDARKQNLGGEILFEVW